MAQEIWIELITTRQAFLQALGLFTPDNFNTIPFEGSWTAGQVAEHIFKSVDGTPQLLTGEALPTERDPAMHVDFLRKLFLDFETKLKSPDFVLPSDGPKDIQSLTRTLADELAAVIEAAQTTDTSLTIANFEFPGMGPLTRLELLNFISVHVKRHTRQLTEIYKHCDTLV